MNRNDERPADPSPDKTNSTGERPRGGSSPHAGENESTPGISSHPGDEDRPLLQTQQPVLVPATGTHTEPGEEPNRLPRTGDRDLDVNGAEQDDDGQPGTGLGPDGRPVEKDL